MKPKSSENLFLIPSVDTGRIAFDDKFDVGELFPQGNFVSSRTHASEGKLRGIIWTNQEILVNIVGLSHRVLSNPLYRLSDIKINRCELHSLHLLKEFEI